MYRGYKVCIDNQLFVEYEEREIYLGRKVPVDKFEMYELLGKSLFRDVINVADQTLLDCISKDGMLKGDVIQEKWFPILKGKFDVFISHSHNDEDLAFALAGWLNEKFGLKCFLDKYVWNSADGLIRKLDDLCRKPGNSGYSYRNRNMTTSQVHAMLTSAIMQMIDNCDVLFLLNTPESVNVIDDVHEYTLSPWIFLEIGFSKVVEKKWNNKKRQRLAAYSVTAETVQMRMKLDTSHLTELRENDLHDWFDVWNEAKRWGNREVYIKRNDEKDPLIILDRQHELPLKGNNYLFE